MPMYSRLTSVSTQLGGRPTIAFSGNVSSIQQHSIRGTPLRKRRKFPATPLNETRVDTPLGTSIALCASRQYYNLTLNEAVDLAQNRPLWRLMSTYGATQN